MSGRLRGCAVSFTRASLTLSCSLCFLSVPTLLLLVFVIFPAVWIFPAEPSDPYRQTASHTRLPSCSYPFTCWFSAGQEVRREASPLLQEVVEHAGLCEVGGCSRAAVCQAFLSLSHHNKTSDTAAASPFLFISALSGNNLRLRIWVSSLLP